MTIDKKFLDTLDQLDLAEATGRVDTILHKQAQAYLDQVSLAGAPKTGLRADGLPPAPRKKRSDAGVPKKAPADPDMIVLRLTVKDARDLALHYNGSDAYLAGSVQDQIIDHLRKQLDLLTKQK